MSFQQTVAVLLLALSLASGAALPAGAQEPEQATPESPTADWHEDPLCRMVFMTVLEGLYTDGVPTSVVDTIVGKDAPPDKKVKRFFVFRCKLCHAVFDAFRTYQRRPTFYGNKGVDTFAHKPIAPEILKAIQSENAYTRVSAMGKLVKPWIERKLVSMDLSKADSQRILKGLVELAQDGANRTHELRKTDPDYANWDFYGACQACDAIETVSRMGQQGQLKPETKERGERKPAGAAAPHVRVGQRYHYRLDMSGVRMDQVWEVTGISDTQIKYTLSTIMNGKVLGKPTPLDYPLPKATDPAPPANQELDLVEESITLAGRSWECWVFESNGLRTWIARRGKLPTFPPLLKQMKGDQVTNQLVRIEEPGERLLPERE